MKNIIILMFFLFSYGIKSQLLNSEIKTKTSEIFNFLKKNNEISSSENLNDYKELIYSREIKTFNNRKIFFFEIGITVSHSRKFIAVLNNQKFTILPTENFNEESDELLNNIYSLKEKVEAKQFVKFLKDLIYIYESNIKTNNNIPKLIKE